MAVISSDMVLKPLPDIACFRSTQQMYIEDESVGTANIETTLEGTQKIAVTISGNWQRCPSRDNTA